jgi:transcriptional antiterminator RfaH
MLPESFVNEIRIRVTADGLLEINQGLHPGQKVQIAQGPFEGLEALVTRLIDARDRVVILVEYMGRSLHAEASVADLVPLNGVNF